MTTPAPDFEALRAKRNQSVAEATQKLADEMDMPIGSLQSNFNPNACYCACNGGGPCEHNWDGPVWESDDGCTSSATCSRCGCTAMSHSLRTGP